MTQPERKKVPPIVPKKKKSLYDLNSQSTDKKKVSSIPNNDTIIIPHLIARKDNNDIVPQNKPHVKSKIDEKLVESLLLDTSFTVPQPKKNEPKPITLDSIMKNSKRTDIKIGAGSFNHIKVVETPLEKKLETTLQVHHKKAPPPPPPPTKPKPLLKPSQLSKTSNPNSKSNRLDNTPEFLKQTMQKRLQFANTPSTGPFDGGIPLPGLASSNSFSTYHKPTSTRTATSFHRSIQSSPFTPQKSRTIDNSSLDNRPKTLTHPNKTRAKGPKRRLPKSISETSSVTPSRTTSVSSSISSALSEPPLRLHKNPPPVPKKSSKVAAVKV